MVFLFTRPMVGLVGLVGPWSMPRIVVFLRCGPSLECHILQSGRPQIFETTVLDE